MIRLRRHHAVTATNVNDIAAAKAMPIEAGATYVFDLGYYDFGFWAKLDALGCRLVARFKANTPLKKPREIPLDPGSPLLSDRIGFLPARQGMNRKNPMQDVGSARSLSRPDRPDTAPPHQRSRRARSRDRGLYKRCWRSSCSSP
jgi:hypothetical protein